VTLGGQDIPAGALLLPTILAANHDEDVFADPHRYDIRRRPNPHLSFGDGVHTCQGAGLGRLEARLILRVLLERLDNIAVADRDALDLFPGLNYGVTALPITYTRRTPA
jgi:cytochrome P450